MCYNIETDRLSVMGLRGKATLNMRIVKTAEARKNEILDTAEQLFASKGFDNTSTNDIINAIGIARGTLYHHFRSKEDILDSVIDRISETLMRNARAIAEDKSIPLMDRLTGSIKALNVESRIGEEVMIVQRKGMIRVPVGVVQGRDRALDPGDQSQVLHGVDQIRVVALGYELGEFRDVVVHGDHRVHGAVAAGGAPTSRTSRM